MDKQMGQHQQHQSIKRTRSKRSKDGMKKISEKQAMKVVYISTPIKVKTSASNFREVVQELTGQESDVVRIMDKCGGKDTWVVPHQNHANKFINHGQERIRDHRVPVGATLDDKSSVSSSSEELNMEHFDGVYNMKVHESLGQFGHPNLLYDPFGNQLDALGSY